MTQKDKELLFKDLCARLPYRVIVKDRNGIHTLSVGNTEFTDLFSSKCNIKPYLRSMSSMTEEERKYWKDISLSRPDWDFTARCLDWLNSHHFDYRGLIEKDLAFEAPKDMYNIKNE